MPAVHIRDVPDDVLAALERRAARHDRSLEKELWHILNAIAQEHAPSQSLPPLSLKLADVSPTSTWRREEIYGDDGR